MISGDVVASVNAGVRNRCEVYDVEDEEEEEEEEDEEAFARPVNSMPDATHEDASQMFASLFSKSKPPQGVRATAKTAATKRKAKVGKSATSSVASETSDSLGKCSPPKRVKRPKEGNSDDSSFARPTDRDENKTDSVPVSVRSSKSSSKSCPPTSTPAMFMTKEAKLQLKALENMEKFKAQQARSREASEAFNHSSSSSGEKGKKENNVAGIFVVSKKIKESNNKVGGGKLNGSCSSGKNKKNHMDLCIDPEMWVSLVTTGHSLLFISLFLKLIV